MKKVKVAVSGLPGKIPWEIANAVANSEDLELFPFGLTGQETMLKNSVIGGVPIRLLAPNERHMLLDGGRPDLIIDLTDPDDIKDNVSFYARIRIPFVSVTTGGCPDYVHEAIKAAAINAVITFDESLNILDAARYLFKKEREPGNVGNLYSMADVLRKD